VAKKRTYTLCSACGFTDRPALTMSGKWLMEKGFYIGDVLEVIESKNMLILTKVGTYADIHKNKSN